MRIPSLFPWLGLLLARTAVLLGVAVLVCVPGLTRMSQKLETASRAPSFSTNIDCPPKKVAVVPAPGASPAPLATFEVLAAVPPGPVPARDLLLPRSPFLVVPPPLRAPPSVLLA